MSDSVTVYLPLTSSASGDTYQQAGVTYEAVPLQYDGGIAGFSITLVVEE